MKKKKWRDGDLGLKGILGKGKNTPGYALKLSSCLMIMLQKYWGSFDRQGGESVNEGLRSLRKTRGGSGE